MIKARIIAVILIAFNWCAAQSYVNYSEKDGLPSNHVYKITQDVDGFIWIATDEGLVKYNGSEFQIFTTQDGLPTNDIWNIFPGKDGKLWYIAKSTSMGYILDNAVHDFKNEKDGSSIDPIYTGFTGDSIIPSGTFISHKLNANLKWEKVKYNNYESYQNISYLINKKYKGLVVDKLYDGKLNLITHDDKLETIKDILFDFNSHSRGQLTDSLYFDNSILSYGYINLNNLETRRYTYENELNIPFLKYPRIHLVNNEIQLSGEHVVTKLDTDLKAINVVHIPKELNSHYSFIDKENTIWIATFSNGIYKYSLNEQQIKNEFINSKIIDIKNLNNQIIALVDGKGFYEFDKTTDSFEPYVDTDLFLYDVEYIKETNASHFITKKNIITVTDESHYSLDFDKVNERARSMTFHKGFIYGHFTAGIKKITPYSLEEVNVYKFKGLRCETSFKNQLIIGGSNGLYQLKNDEVVLIESLKSFKKPVIDLAIINENNLLVSTSGYGVYHTDLKTIHLLEGSAFLKSNNPCFIDNHLYLPSNQGIYHYEFYNNKFELKHIWNNTNGLPTNKINGVEKVDNKLLVATNQGIIHFPLDYKSSQNLLNLIIESAQYEQVDLRVNNHVDYSSNGDLQIEVKNIDFRNHQKLSYDFKLFPTQKNWVKASSSNLTFSDLTPGHYTLEIRSEGIIKELDFYVEPRWYQRWWFYGLVLIGLISLVILLTKTITKRNETKKNKDLIQSKKLSELQLKALRSQMNPHFVFNSLTAIQYYINENDFETSDTYLVKFSRLVREFFELSKEQHITLDREVELLKNYLELEKLRFKAKLNFKIIIDPELDTTSKLPSMLLQPIVENAVNHGIFNKSSSGTITITFERVSKEQIKIYIKDDGVGYQFKEDDHRYKSSFVLDDRLRYLKESGLWEIDVTRGIATDDENFPGHEVIFNLKKLKDESL